MDYRGKVALISGGSSGLGLAAARKLAGQGAHVWILGRNHTRLDEAMPQILAEKISDNQRFGCLPADVTQPGEVDLAVQQLVQAAGVPDLVINSVGRCTPGYLEDQGLDVFRDMMDVNYYGTLNVTMAVIPGMIQRGSGAIVNITSMTGYVGLYGFAAYSAAKHAVRGFTDALRAEMKTKGIQVSIVFPPTMDTPGLVEENRIKAPDILAFEGNVKAMSPEAVAEIMLRDVARGRYMILPGFDNVMYYQAIRFAGNLAYPVIDWMVSSAQKKTGRRSQR